MVQMNQQEGTTMEILKQSDWYVVGFTLGVGLFTSWIFSWEVLFLLSIIVTLALASIMALVLGGLVLTERLHLMKEDEEWSGLQPERPAAQ
jgi:hypothetical protein